MPPVLWEQHCCLPLLPSADITELARYPLGSYLSVNVGYAPQSTADALALIRQFRRDALADGRFRLVRSVEDTIGDDRTIALAFDLEDSGPLGGDLDNVRVFHELGVRSLLPTYNHANAAGCGCLDTADTGLTAYGRDLIRTLNEVGLFADGSHCSPRTGLDTAEITTAPMIYSHSNFAALWPHPRNITDDQARACAATGGVIGINGVGIFLGHNAPEARAARIEAIADHLAYGADLVGIDHIGLGSDFSFDGAQFNEEVAATPENFSEDYTRWGPLQWTPPEDLLGRTEVPGLEEALTRRGFDKPSRAAIFGANFRRAAHQAWE
ncbi:dipeptidase [Nocardia blacklockiae]|uniref:dipeptidase n=1 Tax=Nocardia blacklockiae TaxID=480036 RepID=UPI001893072E|nr:membrane dipeptidase [Nocardia blacklockiae]MBF6173001.1 dipeptidase [Nocardia blacklockiae]